MKIRENGKESICILCTDCGTPIAQVVGDCLVVKVKHHGRVHVSVLPLTGLLSLTVPQEIRDKVKAMT